MKKISQETIMKALDTCYEKTLNGIPKLSPPVDEFADDYLRKNSNVKLAAKSMLNHQIAKCTTSGFVTGFGGAITMPVTIPANMGSVMYIQMRMIACAAYMGGYDIKSDQVQTLVYACLAGISVGEAVKKVSIKFGEKIATKAVEKIPGKVLLKINQKIGFRLVTKFGEKGIINLWKLIPGAGAVINGGLDLIQTKAIADRAYKMFIENDFSVSDNSKDNYVTVSDMDFN